MVCAWQCLGGRAMTARTGGIQARGAFYVNQAEAGEGKRVMQRGLQLRLLILRPEFFPGPGTEKSLVLDHSRRGWPSFDLHSGTDLHSLIKEDLSACAVTCAVWTRPPTRGPRPVFRRARS